MLIAVVVIVVLSLSLSLSLIWCLLLLRSQRKCGRTRNWSIEVCDDTDVDDNYDAKKVEKNMRYEEHIR